MLEEAPIQREVEYLQALFLGGPLHGQTMEVKKSHFDLGFTWYWAERTTPRRPLHTDPVDLIGAIDYETKQLHYKYVPQAHLSEQTMFEDTYQYKHLFAPSGWYQADILAALGDFLSRQWITNDPDGTIQQPITLDEQMKRNKERVDKRDPTLYRPRSQQEDTGPGLGELRGTTGEASGLRTDSAGGSNRPIEDHPATNDSL